MRNRIVVRVAVAGCAVLAALSFVASAAPAKQPGSRDRVSYHGWTTGAGFASGTFDGA
jgi:hypothetical protein